MKVALCCIGRLENQYAVEYVEWYKKLGIDKIFVYDNNHEGEEHFEDVLQPYIDDGLVEIVDYRDRSVCQLSAYQDCYNKHNEEYDWICFFDMDEFLVFADNGMNINDFLSQDIFNDYGMIHVNWKIYGDNDLVKYENKPLMERFKEPKMPLDFKKTYNFPENNHIKSIIRGGLENVKWSATPHTPIGVDKCCDVVGAECVSSSPFNAYNFDIAWLNHYQTKTIEEWVLIKSLRGYPDGNKDFFKANNLLDDFFKINEKTDEKVKYADKLINDRENNLDIFICTHTNFTPLVKNEHYKIINCNDINNDTWNGLKGSFYSEIMSYFYIAENYKLKDYVGFCHYRKYWNFMDDIPNVEEIINKNTIIVPKPLKFKRTIKEQYDRCHNIEDLYIVGGILAERYPDYSKVWRVFLNSNVMFPYNMFIMKREEFLEYIKFVKEILDEYLNVVGYDIEKRIENNKENYLKNVSPNDDPKYQYRIGGYLAERLTNLWIIKHHTKVAIYGVKITEQKYNKE